jgi:glycosyltransferase involved in cell wall biosynthesis
MGIKILRINSINGPSGGVEQYIKETNECLKKLGNEILTVEINSTENPGTKEDTINIYVNGKKIVRLFKDLSTDKIVFNSLMEAYNSIKPDIIHIHHFRVSYMSIAKFINSVETPCVYTAHDAQLVCPISTLVLPNGDICEGGIKTRCMFTGCKVGTHVPYEMLRVWSFKFLLVDKISAYICPSEDMKNYMDKYGFKPSYFIRSYPNIDIKVLQKLDFPDSNSLGYIGRIDKYKGLQILIKALKSVKLKFPNVRLRIAGTGDYLDEIKKLALTEGVSENVEFLGYLGRERHRDFFSSVNFTVIPSLMTENIIFTAQEAFSYGRPVIASKIGGIPEIVRDGFNGYLVKPYGVAELANRIIFMLSERELLKKLGNNAFETINEVMLKNNGCKEILSLYENIVKGKKK